MVELVCNESMWGKLGSAGRLDGLESLCPAHPGVAVFLLRGHVRHAQPVVVLRLDLQATDHVLLRKQRHRPRPPVLPDPLPSRNAVVAETSSQEHGFCNHTPKNSAPLLQPVKATVKAREPLRVTRNLLVRLQLSREQTFAAARNQDVSGTYRFKLVAGSLRILLGVPARFLLFCPHPWTRSGASVANCGLWPAH